jgi:hypothetical protein
VRAPSAPSIPGIVQHRHGEVQGDRCTTYRYAEEDFGMTNMHDNLREGDIAAKAPSPVQTAEAEQLTRAMMDATPTCPGAGCEQVNNFWMKGERPSLPGIRREPSWPANAPPPGPGWSRPHRDAT